MINFPPNDLKIAFLGKNESKKRLKFSQIGPQMTIWENFIFILKDDFPGLPILTQGY